MNWKGYRSARGILGLVAGMTLLAACGQGNADVARIESAQIQRQPQETISIAQLEGMAFNGGPFKDGAKIAKYDPIDQTISIPSCQSTKIFFRESSVCPRVVWQKDKTPQLVLDLHYFGKDDWLFLQGVKVAMGDHVISRAYDWNSAFSEQKDREHSWRTLHEWGTVVVSNNPADVAAMVAATEARARLVGKATYQDLADFAKAGSTMAWAAKIYTRYKDTILVN